MKKGGTGGSHTITGLHFEKEANLLTKVAEVPGYEVRGNKIYYKGNYIASSYPQYRFYTDFLKNNGINYLDYVSKRYLPDEAIFVPSTSTLYVVEMKFQSGGGSVDEKLQTADFKRKIYLKLVSKLGVEVKYCYVLSDYFNEPRYRDAFEYIKNVGCSHFFNRLPLTWLDFPTPEATSDYDDDDVEAAEG